MKKNFAKNWIGDKAIFYVKETRKKDGIHQFHSQQVTDIKISNISNVTTLSMWAEELVASDLKLSSFLKTVNNVSKMLDENGEPKVFYHGSPNKFDTFDRTKGRQLDYATSTGFWFTPTQSFADSFYGSLYTYPVFLNIKNPYVYTIVSVGL